MLPTPERIAIQRASGVLPSRAAYNLFWVGRYVERAEATLRLVRALLNRMTETDEEAALTMARLRTMLAAWSAGPNDIPHARSALIARSRADPRRHRRIAAAPGQGRAPGRLGHPRPFLTGCLAGAQ